MSTPLVHRECLLEKFSGKGGWTYVFLPEVLPHKNSPFGWIKVKGKIDDHEIKNSRLMPMGNGKLFFPVNAGIRRKIGKEEGDCVHLLLYVDVGPIEIPEDLLVCLMDDPLAYKAFLSSKEGIQKSIVERITTARTIEIKSERIVEVLKKLTNVK